MIIVKSKDLLESYYCLKFCYCGSQELRSELESKGFYIKELCYNFGVYGWNYTAYLVLDGRMANYLIIDGYRPVGMTFETLKENLSEYFENNVPRHVQSNADFIRWKLGIL